MTRPSAKRWPGCTTLTGSATQRGATCAACRCVVIRGVHWRNEVPRKLLAGWRVEVCDGGTVMWQLHKLLDAADVLGTSCTRCGACKCLSMAIRVQQLTRDSRCQPYTVCCTTTPWLATNEGQNNSKCISRHHRLLPPFLGRKRCTTRPLNWFLPPPLPPWRLRICAALAAAGSALRFSFSLRATCISIINCTTFPRTGWTAPPACSFSAWTPPQTPPGPPDP